MAAKKTTKKRTTRAHAFSSHSNRPWECRLCNVHRDDHATPGSKLTAGEALELAKLDAQLDATKAKLPDGVVLTDCLRPRYGAFRRCSFATQAVVTRSARKRRARTRRRSTASRFVSASART
jgi:hypothetical protein